VPTSLPASWSRNYSLGFPVNDQIERLESYPIVKKILGAPQCHPIFDFRKNPETTLTREEHVGQEGV